jgi:hypothetical protein
MGTPHGEAAERNALLVLTAAASSHKAAMLRIAKLWIGAAQTPLDSLSLAGISSFERILLDYA